MKKLLDSLSPQPPPPGLEDPARRAEGLNPLLLSGKYAEYAGRALRARFDIRSALARVSDPAARRVLDTVAGNVDEVTCAVYDLATRADALSRGLEAGGALSDLSEEVERLSESLGAQTDPYTRSKLEAALDGKLRQMQNLADARIALARRDAELEAALVSLDTILSEVLRADAADALSSPHTTTELSTRLEAQLQGLRAANEALDDLHRL